MSDMSDAATPKSGLLHPDWCGGHPDVLIYVCEQFMDSPIWSSILVADGVGVWLIINIIYRQRVQDKEVLRCRLQLPRHLRARRLWRSLWAVARLSSIAASAANVRGPASSFQTAWTKVALMRSERKKYLHKRDFAISTVIMRALSPVIIIAVSIVIAFETHAFFSVALPWYELGEGPLQSILWWVCALVPVRVYTDYARTSLTDPGRPPPTVPEMPELVAPTRPADSCDPEIGTASSRDRRCKTCNGLKPPRTHHCKVCRRCVLKMDHHCPFVGNCIGLRNYRYFCFFLADLTVGCALLAVSLAPQLPSAYRGYFEKPANTMTFAHRVHIVAAFGVGAIFACTIGSFFFFHMYLLVMNETTLEHMKRRSAMAAARAAAKAAGASSSALPLKIVYADANAMPPNFSRGAYENVEEVCGPPPRWCWNSIMYMLDRFKLTGTAKRSV